MSDDKRSHGSASGGDDLYFVEARSSHEPQMISGVLVTEQWKRIDFASGKTGVPVSHFVPIEYKYHRLLNYEAALALAYGFLNGPRDEDHNRGFTMVPLCLQARLVKVAVKYNWTTEEVGVGETISLFHMERDAKFAPRDGDASRSNPQAPGGGK